MTAAGAARHCPGCNGFGPGWEGVCPGVILAGDAVSFHVHDVLRRVPLLARVRILLGLPVGICIETGPGIAVDVSDLIAAGRDAEFGPDDMAAGPWKDMP